MTNEKAMAVQYLKGFAGQPISVEYVSNSRLKIYAGDREITNLVNTVLDRKVSLKTKGVYADGSGYNKGRHIIESVNSALADIDKAKNTHNYIFNSDCFNDITKRKAPKF